ncbi:phage holin family protein [Orbaceae bacterium ac157xtp]
MPHNNINIIEIVICALLAMFGSIARIASDYIQGKRSSVIEIICKIVISLFAAVIAYLFCKYFDFDSLIIAISSSLSGWLGTEIVSVFANRFRKEIEDKL